jgi:hypothetical protein
MPHRQAHVAAQWRAARAWLKLAYPRGVQAQPQARFPELAENVAHLRWVADQEGAHYECEPGAGPDAFQNALRAWEAAMLDALAALAHEASHA